MTPTEYVVGFALDDTGRVALIEKNRPAWQAGKLNGIGGHIEETDPHPLAAMRREFLEETGAFVGPWDLFATMEFPAAVIYFFRAKVPAEILDSLETMTDEKVWIHNLRLLLAKQSGFIPNLSWLLPLAAYTADTYQPIRIEASTAESL